MGDTVNRECMLSLNTCHWFCINTLKLLILIQANWENSILYFKSSSPNLIYWLPLQPPVKLPGLLLLSLRDGVTENSYSNLLSEKLWSCGPALPSTLTVVVNMNTLSNAHSLSSWPSVIQPFQYPINIIGLCLQILTNKTFYVGT